MKIDSQTLSILKNFSQINQSLIFQKGNVVSIFNPSRTVIAKSTLSVDFPQRFAIFDLSRFISVLSLFSDPDLIFKDGYVQIKSGKTSVKYVFAEESLIEAPPSKEVELTDIDIVFDLSKDIFANMQKAAATLQLPDVRFLPDGKNITINVTNTKNPTGDEYNVDVPANLNNSKDGAVFDYERLRFIPDDYEVSIVSKYAGHFKAKNIPVEYWVGTKVSE